tara:strand:+ start:1290 stop:1826 length:537 start_codon:yes stop_codon:yes gene_type:complete
MLDEKRVKEAESNVRQYVQDDMLKKQTNQTAMVMYVENCDVSLQTAQKLLSLESKDYSPYLWVIVSSYYSMYYITNAVLLKLGYKVGDKISHKVTVDALIVFVRNKLKKNLLEEYEDTKESALELMSQKADLLIKTLDYEREKRSKFQYQMDEQAKHGKAQTSLDRAKNFVFEMKKLL